MPSPEAQQAITLLQAALGSALDNLPDVVNDSGVFGPDDVALCAADIAALKHLLSPDATGRLNIAAYL